MNRRFLLAMLAVAALGLAGGCLLQYRMQRERECTKYLFAMDTFMQFTAYGKNGEAAVDAAMEEVQLLDALLSAESASSQIYAVNRAGEGAVSEETSALLEKAEEIYASTGGLFDITVYPLMELWGFPSREYHVPSEEELSDALSFVDGSQVRLEDGRVFLGEGQQIDLGGIAKGYTSSRVMEIFREYGVVSGMVSLGGNVQTLNGKPDGSAWQIGIQDPDGQAGEVLASVSVENKAVITSGGYERYFEEDGNTYIHILDPRTGYPAEAGLVSVTVVSEDGTLADALSTSLYIMGREEAVAYWRAHKDMFDMVLITEDGEISVTEGIGDELRTDGDVTVIGADGTSSNM